MLASAAEGIRALAAKFETPQRLKPELDPDPMARLKACPFLYRANGFLNCDTRSFAFSAQSELLSSQSLA
jgi:hypothetical protein